jgi:hypothetical protein
LIGEAGSSEAVIPLNKRCVNNAGSVQANEVAGNGSLTRSLVGTERITLGSA